MDTPEKSNNSANDLQTKEPKSPRPDTRSSGRATNTRAVIIGLFVLAIGLAFAVLLVQRFTTKQHTSSVTTQKICSDELLHKAADSLVPSRTSQEKPTVETILALKNYDRDPNCLLVITNYYVMVQDLANSKLYYDKLVRIAPQDYKFNRIISEKARGLGYLKDAISALEVNQEQQAKGKINSGWNAR